MTLCSPAIAVNRHYVEWSAFTFIQDHIIVWSKANKTMIMRTFLNYFQLMIIYIFDWFAPSQCNNHYRLLIIHNVGADRQPKWQRIINIFVVVDRCHNNQ